MKKDILEVVNPVIHTLQETGLQDGSSVIILASNKNAMLSLVRGSVSCIATLLLYFASKDKNFEMIMRAVIDFLDQRDDDDNTESGDSDNDLESEKQL